MLRKTLLIIGLGLALFAHDEQLQVIEQELVIKQDQEEQKAKEPQTEVLQIVDRTQILQSAINHDQREEQK